MATPLGRPVLPEVKMMYARLPGVAVEGGAVVGRPSRGMSSSTTVERPSVGSRDTSARRVMKTRGRASSTMLASRAAGELTSSGT